MSLGPLRFTNAAGGTVDWTYPGPSIDMQSPASAGAVDGATYTYYAQSFDMSQWEIGRGTYTASSGVFARTAVVANSLGTTAKIDFSTTPQIMVFEATSSTKRTRTVLTSGSGTYNTPAGCTSISVRMVGGGGGGGGGGAAPTAGGSVGGDTTFGLHTASGGAAASTTAPGVGGSGTIGSGAVGLAVSGGGGGQQNNQTSVNGVMGGATGGNSALGGGALGASYAANGASGQTNTGGGGGGGGGGNGTANANGAGGGSGGYVDIIIASPAASYSFAVGTGGTAGASGGSTLGGAGGSGAIIIDEHY